MNRISHLLTATLLFACGTVAAQSDDDWQPPKSKPRQDKPQAKSVPRTPDYAVALAKADAEQLGAFATFHRYIWVPTGDVGSVRAVSFAMNTVSRSPLITRPPVVGGVLMRIDLRRYCTLKTLPEYINVWEQLQFDPTFNLLVTKDTLKLVASAFPSLKVEQPRITRKRQEKVNWRLVDCPPYIGENERGQRVKLTQKWAFDVREVGEVVSLSPVDVAKAEILRINGPHLDAVEYLTLQQLTRSNAPVVHYQYFLTRALTAIQGENVTYKNIFGGLYYDFAGVRGLDEAQILKGFGVDKKVFDDLPSDQRAAVFRSNVTKRPRQFEWFPTLATRDGLLSFAFITSDIAKEDIDIGQHPVMNLADFKPRAHEAFIGKPNGTLLFLLLDAKRKLQDKAPDNVARNHLVPAGHSTELEPAISCIWCHGTKAKADGWIPFGNSVTALRKRGLDIFGDASGVSSRRNLVLEPPRLFRVLR